MTSTWIATSTKLIDVNIFTFSLLYNIILRTKRNEKLNKKLNKLFCKIKRLNKSLCQTFFTQQSMFTYIDNMKSIQNKSNSLQTYLNEQTIFGVIRHIMQHNLPNVVVVQLELVIDRIVRQKEVQLVQFVTILERNIRLVPKHGEFVF